MIKAIAHELYTYTALTQSGRRVFFGLIRHHERVCGLWCKRIFVRLVRVSREQMRKISVSWLAKHVTSPPACTHGTDIDSKRKTNLTGTWNYHTIRRLSTFETLCACKPTDQQINGENWFSGQRDKQPNQIVDHPEDIFAVIVSPFTSST